MSNPTPTPQPSGLGAVLGIVQAVVGIVPRWLVVCAGLIFLAWGGLELYQKAQQVILQTETMRAQKETANTRSRSLDVQAAPKAAPLVAPAVAVPEDASPSLVPLIYYGVGTLLLVALVVHQIAGVVNSHYAASSGAAINRLPLVAKAGLVLLILFYVVTFGGHLLTN